MFFDMTKTAVLYVNYSFMRIVLHWNWTLLEVQMGEIIAAIHQHFFENVSAWQNTEQVC